MKDLDVVAGQVEALARAFLVLAEMTEVETDMDGLTLTSRLRAASAVQLRSRDMSEAVQQTLVGLADHLDERRNARQERAAQAMAESQGQPGPV